MNKQTGLEFYSAVARQTTREWAVVTKLADGTPHVVAAYDAMDDAVEVCCDLNLRGGAATFVIFVSQIGGAA